jgi:hypothetical protein
VLLSELELNGGLKITSVPLTQDVAKSSVNQKAIEIRLPAIGIVVIASFDLSGENQISLQLEERNDTVIWSFELG